jgi:hypothetical protein
VYVGGGDVGRQCSDSEPVRRHRRRAKRPRSRRLRRSFPSGSTSW